MEYDIKELNYDALEFLRRQTVLGPVALIKIANARKEAEIVRKYYMEVEHQMLELDTSIADELEYNYRMRALEREVYKDWERYGDGLGLEEFTEKLVKDNINNNKSKSI